MRHAGEIRSARPETERAGPAQPVEAGGPAQRTTSPPPRAAPCRGFLLVAYRDEREQIDRVDGLVAGPLEPTFRAARARAVRSLPDKPRLAATNASEDRGLAAAAAS